MARSPCSFDEKLVELSALWPRQWLSSNSVPYPQRGMGAHRGSPSGKTPVLGLLGHHSLQVSGGSGAGGCLGAKGSSYLEPQAASWTCGVAGKGQGKWQQVAGYWLVGEGESTLEGDCCPMLLDVKWVWANQTLYIFVAEEVCVRNAWQPHHVPPHQKPSVANDTGQRHWCDILVRKGRWGKCEPFLLWSSWPRFVLLGEFPNLRGQHCGWQQVQLAGGHQHGVTGALPGALHNPFEALSVR